MTNPLPTARLAERILLHPVYPYLCVGAAFAAGVAVGLGIDHA